MIDYKLLNSDLKFYCDALDQIDEKHYKEKQTTLEDGKIIDTGKIRTNERSFVSELKAHYIRKIEDSIVLNDMWLQTDAPKQLIFKNAQTIKKYERTFNVIFPESKNDEFYRVPDIVFHGGPEDFSKQILISEVKICEILTNSLFNIDLFKLSVYHDELQFKTSVLVIANQTPASVINLIKQYLNQKHFLSSREGLYIVVKEFFGIPSIVINPNEIKKANKFFYP